MSVALYKNPKGALVTHGSYSARELFRYCPRKFQLQRVQGWREIEQRASLWFGKCIESAIQAYEENGRQPGAAPGLFETHWENIKNLKEFSKLTYTNKEISWESLLRAGREMMLLYEIRVPELPISQTPKTLFQVPLHKTIFPGSELAVLSNTAYLDMITYPEWDHLLLPRLDPDFERGAYDKRPLIIDIKTSGVALDTDLVALDPQLAEYAWQSRIPDVAFLWFVKHGHELESGSHVTLLASVGAWPAGTELIVLAIIKNDENVIERIYLGDEEAVYELKAALKPFKPRSKVYDAAKESFLREHVASGFVSCVTPPSITKQRLQFSAARISDSDIDETGRAVGMDTMEMLRSHEDNFYPKTGGVRFPNQKCKFCQMRGICLNRSELRDSMLVRTGDEWLEGEE
jgi:hypothetical protein